MKRQKAEGGRLNSPPNRCGIAFPDETDGVEAESGLADFQKAADDFAADMDAWDGSEEGGGADF